MSICLVSFYALRDLPFLQQRELQILQSTHGCCLAHLDAVLVEETRQREAFLLVQRLAEDHQLLEEEDSPLFHAAEVAAVWVRHHEGVLQQQAALSHDLPLPKETNGTGF